MSKTTYGSMKSNKIYVDIDDMTLTYAEPKHGMNFASKLEAQVFVSLSKQFDWLKDIEYEFPIEIDGYQGFMPFIWKVNFAIGEWPYVLLIKVRESITRDFILLLRNYSHEYRMKNLIIVASAQKSRPIPNSTYFTVALDELPQKIINANADIKSINLE